MVSPGAAGDGRTTLATDRENESSGEENLATNDASDEAAAQVAAAVSTATSPRGSLREATRAAHDSSPKAPTVGGSTGGGRSQEEPHADIVPAIPQELAADARSNRRSLTEGVDNKQRELPPYAKLLPLAHQSRDFIPFDTWRKLGDAAAAYMVGHGEPLSRCVSVCQAQDLPTALQRDKSNPVIAYLLGNIGRVAYGTELVEQGWTVLRGAVDFAGRGFHLKDVTDPVGTTLQAYEAKFPDEALFGRKAETADAQRMDPVWAPIHDIDNNSGDAQALRDGQGRLMVHLTAVRSSLSEAQQRLYVAKLMCDVAIASVAHQVLLGAQAAQGRSEEVKVRAPKSGSRILLTTSRAQRQRPHVDSEVMADPSNPPVLENEEREDTIADKFEVRPDTKLPQLQTYKTPATKNYFVMASGDDGFVAVTWPGSVLIMHRKTQQLPVPCGMVPVRIVVPPRSIFVVRGDLVHAGAGAADDIARMAATPIELTYGHSIRLHMYLQDPDQPIKDAIFTEQTFVFGQGDGGWFPGDDDEKAGDAEATKASDVSPAARTGAS